MSASAERRERPNLTDLLASTSPAARARQGAVGLLPVLPELASLLPGGGLQLGTVTTVSDTGLLLALAAGPFAHRPDGWVAVVGMPDLGLQAAAGYGLDRLLLADTPGENWPEVVSALLPAVDVVLLAPGTAPTPTLAGRLTARLRQHSAVILTPGPWPGAQLHMEITARQWRGLGDGHGILQSRRVTVRASGRGAAGPGRTLELLLPDETGAVTAVDGTAVRLPDSGRPWSAAVAY